MRGVISDAARDDDGSDNSGDTIRSLLINSWYDHGNHRGRGRQLDKERDREMHRKRGGNREKEKKRNRPSAFTRITSYRRFYYSLAPVITSILRDDHNAIFEHHTLSLLSVNGPLEFVRGNSNPFSYTLAAVQHFTFLIFACNNVRA